MVDLRAHFSVLAYGIEAIFRYTFQLSSRMQNQNFRNIPITHEMSTSLLRNVNIYTKK